MTVRRKTKKALAMLLPAGVLGISSALASARLEPSPQDRTTSAKKMSPVSERLREIRAGVSEMSPQNPGARSGVLLADWVNGGFGWGNGGWHNGGWHNAPGWGNGGWGNGGWGNGGWHNWGNGGWHNWHNGWHNWHNFWHNW